jgi:hypothetical protein
VISELCICLARAPNSSPSCIRKSTFVRGFLQGLANFVLRQKTPLSSALFRASHQLESELLSSKDPGGLAEVAQKGVTARFSGHLAGWSTFVW